MMDHIRNFDWCKKTNQNPDFVDKKSLDNCVINRILDNRFHDPFIDIEPIVENVPKLDLSYIYKQHQNKQGQNRVFVPGLRPSPWYLKQSSLTAYQHLQCIKVLCAQRPDVLKAQNMQRPNEWDRKTFEEVKEKYEKEQAEYIQWAKTLWTNQHCGRGLRPKPAVGMVWEAEFNLKASEMASFPKNYKMAAQIPLGTTNNKCDMIFDKELISVNISQLPQVKYPDMSRRTSVLCPYPVPEPCTKHPCRFVLPNDKSMTVLPLPEVHRELAQYALEHGALHVASEKALRCLVELDRLWTLPLSVCQAITADGDKCNVLVLGSDFSVNQDCAMTRTYKAYKHMLEYSLLLPTKTEATASTSTSARPRRVSAVVNYIEISSDEEDDNLVIDTDEETRVKTEIEEKEEENVNLHELRESIEAFKKSPRTPNGKNSQNQPEDISDDEFYKCTCKDTEYAHPPPRSFRKWQVKNKTTRKTHSMIVHTSHKARGRGAEVILEPLLEYQIELGASLQSEHKIKALALSLLLRRNASLLNVRIDSQTGDVVELDSVRLQEHLTRHGDVVPDISNTIYTVLDQLQGLVPGHYILKHEPNHGSNALLFATRLRGVGEMLSLEFDSLQLAEPDETKSLKTPTLAPVLLPFHKFRKILPCAFTPYPNQVAKEIKRPAPRQSAPPQAIKWPKRRTLRKRKNVNNVE